MKLTSGSITRICFWCAAALLGFSQAWSSRMTLTNDTISFLDMGDYLVKGEWSAVINGYWNPLFAGLLGLTMAILKPSAYWEYPVVHFLLFFIFLFALGCFDFFLRQMMLYRREQNSSDELCVPDWMWMTIAYTLFLWSSLALITLTQTDPDMLVAAFFYLASGLLIRIRRGNPGWSTYVALGLALGLGYLTKAIMFPISLLCLAVTALMGARSRRGIVHVTAGTLAFILLSAPLVIAISVKLGKPTFGESGTFNALIDIDHVAWSFYWRGGDGQYGSFTHPAHQIFDRPATFEFANPVGGSYPLWYDPSYWFEGAKPDYRLKEMAKNLAINLGRTGNDWEFGLNGSIVAALFMLFWVSGRRWLILKDVGAFWFLLIPSLIPLAMYGVLHISTRYIGGFVVVAFSSLFFSIKMPPTPDAGRLFSGATILLLLMLISPVGPEHVTKKYVLSLLDFLKPLNTKVNPNAEVVRGLQAMGLRPGDAITSLEFSNCATATEDGTCAGPAYWARLGGFRIVAEAYYIKSCPSIYSSYCLDTRSNNFWEAGIERQEKVINALTKTGARAVVSLQEPRGPDAANWEKIGATGYHIRWLEPAATASHSNCSASDSESYR
jgi:hypothetical protein